MLMFIEEPLGERLERRKARERVSRTNGALIKESTLVGDLADSRSSFDTSRQDGGSYHTSEDD
jgi:hypothetical protein